MAMALEDRPKCEAAEHPDEIDGQDYKSISFNLNRILEYSVSKFFSTKIIPKREQLKGFLAEWEARSIFV